MSNGAKLVGRGPQAALAGTEGNREKGKAAHGGGKTEFYSSTSLTWKRIQIPWGGRPKVSAAEAKEGKLDDSQR